MTVKLKDPTFEEIQWTGANLLTIKSFVDAHTGSSAPTTYTEQEDGALSIWRPSSMLGLYVPPNGYLVYGPLRGGDSTQATWATMTAAEFAAQYEAVPG